MCQACAFLLGIVSQTLTKQEADKPGLDYVIREDFQRGETVEWSAALRGYPNRNNWGVAWIKLSAS